LDQQLLVADLDRRACARSVRILKEGNLVARKGKIIKGKRGKIGRAKPPSHPMGPPFMSEQKGGLSAGQVVHGVPLRGDRAGKMEGTVSKSGGVTSRIGKLRGTPKKASN
jgi:hypothetical protein